MWSYLSRWRGACHRSSKPAADDERAGDQRMEESSEEEMKVARPNDKLVVGAR